MNQAVYTIAGGDYDHGGSASKQLKEQLKKLGADATAIRRTMVAAYEAEMNTVIHAKSGSMRVALDASRVDVTIEDEGPGIANIPLALTEGYSTAPPEARQLGFGAGMGLPNIRRNTDRFTLQSVPGQGTRVRFSVLLRPQEAAAREPISLGVVDGRCRECLACLRACPTGAIRVRESAPRVLDHLCIDCTSCIRACAPRALTLREASAEPKGTGDDVLVLPGSLLGQFAQGMSFETVRRTCEELGFREVRFSDDWERALREAVVAYAQDGPPHRPVLSPACPAVVALIRLRFPSLLGHLAPFLTPLEAAVEELTAPRIVFAALCPAQAGTLRHPTLLTSVDVVTPSGFRDALVAQASHEPEPVREEGFARLDAGPEGVMQVSGMSHVLSVLESLENGRLPETPVFELFACDQGCYGSPLWREDAFVARCRHAGALGNGDHGAQRGSAIRRIKELKPRGGVRLDPDMGKAIEKLARIDALGKTLPGRDCGVCGAPTCAALAEDVVQGRADLSACIYRNSHETEESR